ncbi:MAG: 5'-nucleotidase C-terminal domain-containing protein [Clostridia bacterium]|nr:5'-nucleotidase C-terminal domain-containing protein [Clostridia bacterium]
MIFHKNKTIELFDKFLLTIPTKLKHHQDEISNTKALFIKVTGKQFKDMIKYMLRPEALNYDHSEFYQFSRGMKVVVSLPENKITELTYDGEEIDDDKILSVGLQSFHFKNMEDIFGISEDEVKKNAPCKVLSTNSMDVLDEYLSGRELVTVPVDERWIILT